MKNYWAFLGFPLGWFLGDLILLALGLKPASAIVYHALRNALK